jgi:competence protein ComEA
MENAKQFLQFLMIFSFSHGLFAIDINTASVSELAKALSGIGPTKAQRIVEYREKIGGFVSPEQLMEVYGIGPKLLERNLSKIEISPSPSYSSKLSNEKALLKDDKTRRTGPTVSPPLLKEEENSLFGQTQLRLSPEFEKQTQPISNSVWDAVIIIPLFILCLLIFIKAWLQQEIKDKAVVRQYWVSTTFVCSGCGQTEEFKNVYYKDLFRVQQIVPPGWVTVPNWRNELCDYCAECSKSLISTEP